MTVPQPQFEMGPVWIWVSYVDIVPNHSILCERIWKWNKQHSQFIISQKSLPVFPMRLLYWAICS